MDGAVLGAAAGVGFVGGVLGATLVWCIVRQGRCQGYGREGYVAPVRAELQTDESVRQKVMALGERQRRGSIVHSDRELRQQLAVLNAKIERLSGVDLEEGDNWSAWDGLAAAVPSHALQKGWAKELIAPELRLDKLDLDTLDKPKPVSTVLFTDLGGTINDIGDQVALFLLRGLETLDFACARAVIVCGSGSPDRVPRAKHIMKSLGFGQHCKLGFSTPEESKPRNSTVGAPGTAAGITASAIAAKQSDLMSASEAFLSVIDDASLGDYSLVVCLFSSVTEFAKVLRTRGVEVARKLQCVCLLGAVFEPKRGVDVLSAAKAYRGADFYLRPDSTHPHHIADPEASTYVYRRLQVGKRHSGLPNILTLTTASGCACPRLRSAIARQQIPRANPALGPCSHLGSEHPPNTGAGCSPGDRRSPCSLLCGSARFPL